MAWQTYSMFVAPSTTPTMLYLLEKNITQSFNVFFSSSLRSCQSGLTSSGDFDDLPKAFEASLPAKTASMLALLRSSRLGRGERRPSRGHATSRMPYHDSYHQVGKLCCPSHRRPCPTRHLTCAQTQRSKGKPLYTLMAT